MAATQRCFEWLLKNPNRIPEGEQALRRSRTADERKPFGFPLILQKKGPELHRAPARNGLTKRLKRSFLLLLRGLLGGLLCRLLSGLLLCHHALPPSPKDMDPIGSIGLAGSMWW